MLIFADESSITHLMIVVPRLLIALTSYLKLLARGENHLGTITFSLSIPRNLKTISLNQGTSDALDAS